MGYSAYPEYISVNNIIQSVPSNWRTERLNDVSNLKTSNVDKKSVKGQKAVKLCNYVDVYYHSKITSDLKFMEATAKKNEIEKFSLQYGDVVFTKDSEDPFDIGIPTLIYQNIDRLVCGYHLTIVRPYIKELDGCFAYYALNAELSKFQFTLASNGVTRFGLTYQGTKNIKICVPPIKEQQQIAKFLDHKTGQIDQLIAKKKALIEKLNEKRIAVITQAVTKGLDPTVPMRDSEVEWLGEVPEHWEVLPVKFLARIVRGKFSHRPRNDPAFYNGEYPFIQTGDISGTDKYVNTYSQTLNEKGYTVSKEFPSGSLVMTIAANIGDMAILNFNACFPDSIVGFIPESNIDLDFLYYMFLAMKQKLMSTAVLNTQLNLNIDRIATIQTVCPSYNTQINITKYLEGEIKHLDGIELIISQAIDRLTEYRTSLITAAVTGKIDVRNIEIPKAACKA